MGYKISLDEKTNKPIITDGDRVVQNKPAKHGDLKTQLTGDGSKHTELHVVRRFRQENQSDCLVEEIEFGVVVDEYKKITFEEMTEYFEKYRQRWLDSKECKVLIGLLEDMKDNLKVKNVIGLATGSLHATGDKGEMNGNAGAFQLAALVTISEVLGEGDLRLPIIVQDPAYSSIDREFLTDYLEFKVVDDPDVFPRITRESVVLNIASNLTIHTWMTQGEWPAAMVTDLLSPNHTHVQYPSRLRWENSPMEPRYVWCRLAGATRIRVLDENNPTVAWLAPPTGDDERAWCDDARLWVRVDEKEATVPKGPKVPDRPEESHVRWKGGLM